MPAARPRVLVRLSVLASLVVLAFFLATSPGYSQDANSMAIYGALRNLTLGSESVSLSNIDLKRDGGPFRFRSGTVCLPPPINGKVTGAVFVGDGTFLLNPPSEPERKSLEYLTKEPEFNERFEKLLLRFTDSTY